MGTSLDDIRAATGSSKSQLYHYFGDKHGLVQAVIDYQSALVLGGTLNLLGSTPVSATGGVGAVDARLSPDGRTLYVDESRIGKVGEFAVNGGNLTELASSPISLPNTGTAGIATN